MEQITNKKTTFLEALRDEFGIDVTETENGAKTYKTTGSKLIDLFFKVGALRSEISDAKHLTSDRLKDIVTAAFDEDELNTLKILLYARDILDGMGERDVPRFMTAYLIDYIDETKKTAETIESYEEMLTSLIKGFKEIGRWDDLVDIYCHLNNDDSSLIRYIKNEIILTIQTQLLIDIKKCDANEPISLLAKWLPSENTSSKETRKKAAKMREALKLDRENNKSFTPREYRKLLSKLRKHIRIIENNLREKKYDFDYASIPSKAMAKYSKAFNRNDSERFNTYLKELSEGKQTINTKTLTPANICKKIRDLERHTNNRDKVEEMLLDTQWKNMLKEFEELNDISAIVAADVSGSMGAERGEAPIDVSIGLALFFAYKATGPFANHFLDFCGDSRMHEIDPNRPIFDNYMSVAESSRDMNTNVDSVFRALLDAAVEHNSNQEDLPKYLILISDMEFDECIDEVVNFKSWKRRFKEKGYKLPYIVFWNADSRNDISPAKSSENAFFISGRSSNGFKMLNILEKYQITDQNDLAFLAMMKTIERYNIYFNQ